MPDGVDLDHNHEETRPADGQWHEPWNESRTDGPGEDDSAGSGCVPAGDGPVLSAPDAGADTAPAEKRAGDAQAGGESWLFARHVAEKIAGYEERGQEPPQAAQEDADEPDEPHGGGAAATGARPERSPDEAHKTGDAAMSAAAELTAVLRTFKADFARWTDTRRSAAVLFLQLINA